jgi:DNA polymerase
MSDPQQQQAQRAVRQFLESWQRAGLTHLKHVAPVLDAPAPPVNVTDTPASETRTPLRIRPADPVSEPPTTPAPVTAPEPPQAETPPQTADPRKDMSVPRTTKSRLSKADRQAQLEIVAEEVSHCQKCPELASTRTQTVFGVGNPSAKIMFIGEAPGADEDKQGEPFVGRAGKLLDKIIEACQLKRSEIYIANILRCRPPGNRNPSDQEASNCRGYLDAQIEIVDPDYLVCWGSVAAKNLLSSELPIGKMRGKFYEYGRAKVVCTYHPSYLLRNPSAKKNVWDDMILLFEDMGIDLKSTQK